jgi:chemotaxis protein MotB
MMPLRGRNAEEEERRGGVGMDRWLLTYADMITLLMVFFLMLSSISLLDASKFRSLAASIRTNLLGGPADRSVPDPSMRGENSRVRPEGGLTLEEGRRELARLIDREGLSDRFEIRRTSRGLSLSILGGYLFPKGEADIADPDVIRTLTRLSEVLSRMPNLIQVEGNASVEPIRSERFPSNWELSAARAAAVVQLLQDQGIPKTRLVAVGFGDSRPLVPNDTEEHRSINRRVDLLILNRGPYEGEVP